MFKIHKKEDTHNKRYAWGGGELNQSSTLSMPEDACSIYTCMQFNCYWVDLHCLRFVIWYEILSLSSQIACQPNILHYYVRYQAFHGRAVLKKVRMWNVLSFHSNLTIVGWFRTQPFKKKKNTRKEPNGDGKKIGPKFIFVLVYITTDVNTLWIRFISGGNTHWTQKKLSTWILRLNRFHCVLSTWAKWWGKWANIFRKYKKIQTGHTLSHRPTTKIIMSSILLIPSNKTI